MVDKSRNNKPDMADQLLKRICLSPLDQLAPRYYIEGVLAFAQRSSGESRDKWETQCIASMQLGLKATFAQLPFLSYKIVETEGFSANGRIELQESLSPEKKALSIFNIKRISTISQAHTTPSYGDSRSLPSGKYSPVDGVNGSSLPLDVCQAQLTFIHGQAVLCFAVHHAVFDGVGYGFIISQLAKNCRLVERGCEVFEAAFPRRRYISPDGGFKSTWRSLSCYNPPPPIENDITPNQESKIKRSLVSSFFLAEDRLVQLRKLISNHLSHTNPTTNYISTLDALSALIWCEISRARYAFTQVPLNETTQSPTTRFGLPVSSRRPLELPENYVYNSVVRAATPAIPISSIVVTTKNSDDNAPKYYSLLATLATLIRQTIHSVDKNYIHQIMNLSISTKDVCIFQPRPGENFITGPYDVVISSWMSLPVYNDNVNFGEGLGRVEFLRPSPRDEFDGLCYVLPARPNGDVQVVVGLEEGAMMLLCESKVWEAWLGRSR
jgi:hypothetical protein